MTYEQREFEGPTVLTADLDQAEWRRVVDVDPHGAHCLVDGAYPAP